MQVYPKFSLQHDLINYLEEVSAQYEATFAVKLTNHQIIETMASTLDKNRDLLDEAGVGYRQLLEDLLVESFMHQNADIPDAEMDDVLNILTECIQQN